MIEKTIHIGPFGGGIGSVIHGYIRIFGLPKENAWNSRKNGFVKSLPYLFAICFKILFKKQENIICYHIHMASDGSIIRKLLIALCLKIKNKKFIVHVHGSKFQEHRLQIFLAGQIVKLSNAVICITEQMKNFFEKEHMKCKIYIIPNFCETIVEKPVDLSKHKNPVKIVFAGNCFGIFGKRKGIYDLLTAFEKAKFDFPVQLDLYGAGEVERIREIAEDSTKKDCINVIGWMEHAEYLEKLPNYDFFVLPSHAEVFPMTILEAMGFGIPIVSTYVGGIPEMIENGKSGILFKAKEIDELVNALEKMANNSELRTELGKNAWKDAKERYTPEIVLRKLEEMYGKI